MAWARTGERTGDGWDIRLIAIIADPHPSLLSPIDPLDIFKKAMDKMGSELLAVAHDVESRRLLLT